MTASRISFWWMSGLVIATYLSTGLFTVPSNEVAVVRRFGRATWPPRSSGLHFDLPWPWSQIDRVDLKASRTLTVGEAQDLAGDFLTSASPRPATFLTGDRNLLQLRVTVQYRIEEESLAAWLYESQAPEDRLRLVVENVVTDLVSRSGVDFVHTQGLAELNNRLLSRVREHAAAFRLGCHIEQVSLDRSEPPTRVKADFLDVSNARADMTRSIHEARAYAEQRLAESQADARQLADDAEQARSAAVSYARGAADRFLKLVAQIQQDAQSGGRTYVQSRTLALSRFYTEVVRGILAQSRSKILLDGQPADLVLPPTRTPD